MLYKVNASVLLVLGCGVFIIVFASEIKKSDRLQRSRRQTSSEQDGENTGCQLPPPQPNGLFTPSRRRCPPDNDIPQCQMTPGNPVPHNWLLYHSCDPGYVLNKTATTVSVCLNGHWKPVLPHCVKLCPSLPSSPFTKSKCLYRGKEVSCDSEMRPGTVISAVCQQFYRTSFEKRCSDSGSWILQNQSTHFMDSNGDQENNPVLRCIPECGISSKSEEVSETSTPTIITRPTKPGEVPWIAGIYHKNDGKWDLKCAGTLISNHIVITVAHCVVTTGNVKMEPEDIRVGLGKNNRNFYITEVASGVLEVNNVEIHNLYEGIDAFYAYDIALLSLLVEVQVSAFVMPACFDWRLTSMPESGTLVELTGWSRLPNGTRNDDVTSTLMKFFKNENCYTSLEPRFRKYLTADKACVEKLLESNAGISGAGITFVKEGRHFLAGFISTKIPEKDFLLLFTTDIYFWRHTTWLKNTTNLLKQIHDRTLLA